ncbi:COQ9 family protein [Sphingomonas sp.]|uniref:COQ9 family protein n=1 Tax=Sphingomonas sp. TaxID=28214 RepID=UPI0025DA3F64|nr:COQ9 family protein [Sphingomonas sp.]
MDSTPLADLRRKLALPVAENAVFDGWRETAVNSAAASLGVDPAVARLAFPKGPAEMIAAYVEAIDDALTASFSGEAIAAMRVSQRIRAILIKRFELMSTAKEAIRTALAILALPQNIPSAARLGWRSADTMWRLAGDTATDFNHYSKRAILASIYTATLLVWLDDASEGQADTIAFLDRRLAGVARFEKAKAQWTGSAERRPSLARFAGRLRYPPR